MLRSQGSNCRFGMRVSIRTCWNADFRIESVAMIPHAKHTSNQQKAVHQLDLKPHHRFH